MRKGIWAIAAIVAAAAACEKEPQILEGDEDNIMMTFNASTECNETKSSVGDKTGNAYKVNWNPLDSIAVLPKDVIYGKAYLFVTDMDSLSTTANFSGETKGSGNGYFAVHPWQNITDSDKYGVMSSDQLHLDWGGYYQYATNSSYDPEKAIMVARSDGEGLSFKHIFAYIKLGITFTASEIEISSNDSDLACQGVNVFFDAQGYPNVENDGSSSRFTTVTIRKNEADSLINPGAYYLAVLPQTISGGITITVKGLDGRVSQYTKTTTKSIQLERGHVLNLGVLSSSDFGVDTSTLDGEGTESSPYLITCLEDLNTMAELMNGSTYSKYCSAWYKVTKDIDCGGAKPKTIANNKEHIFCGHFDGNGKTISNYEPGVGDKCVALFGYVKNADFHNLTLSTKHMPMPTAAADYYSEGFSVSPFIGFSYADEGKFTTVTNCSTKSTESIKKSGVQYDVPTIKMQMESMVLGGVVAHSIGSIKIVGCTSDIVVYHYGSKESAHKYHQAIYGGILGYIEAPSSENAYLVIDRCRNKSYLRTRLSLKTYIGGILGYDYDGWTNDVITRITNCVNSGSLINNYQDDGFLSERDGVTGGIIGKHDSDGASSAGDPYIYNCLNTGEMYTDHGNVYCGGAMGYCYDDDTKVYNCAGTGKITGIHFDYFGFGSYLGGMTGNSEGKYWYCHWTNSLPIVDDSADYDYQTSCSRTSIVTAEMMNTNKGNIPSSDYGFTYCDWSGSSETGDLDIEF